MTNPLALLDWTCYKNSLFLVCLFHLCLFFLSSAFVSCSLGGDGFRGAVLVLGSCFPFGLFSPCVFCHFIRVQDDEPV